MAVAEAIGVAGGSRGVPEIGASDNCSRDASRADMPAQQDR